MAAVADYKTSRSCILLRNLIEEKDTKIIELQTEIDDLNQRLEDSNESDISKTNLRKYVLKTKWTYTNLKTAFLGIN